MDTTPYHAEPPALRGRSARRVERGNVVHGFETIPLSPLVAGIVFFFGISGIGQAATLGSLACFGAILASRYRMIFTSLKASWLFLALPLLACASFGWSELPSTSLYYGVQLLITVLVGLFVAHTLPLRSLPLAIWSGALLAVLAGVASGRAGVSAEGPVLIGLMGSKNQFAYFCLLLLLSGLTVAWERKTRLLLRLAALASVPLALLLVYQANATTALVTALATSALLVVLLATRWLPGRAKLFILCMALLTVPPLVVAAPDIANTADRVREDVLEKDATLTGRTLLWNYADQAIAARPVLGNGFNAYWFGKRGLGLLQRFEKDDPRGFSFHDTLRQIAVDLGYVGLALFLVPLAYTLIKLGGLMMARNDPGLFLLAALLVGLLMRLRVELVVSPFSLDTILLWLVFGYVWRLERQPAS